MHPVRNQPSLPSPKQDRSFERLPRNGACDATAIMMDNLEEPARSRPTFVSAPARYVTPLPPRNKTKNKQSKRAKIAESFDRHLLQGPANSVMPRKKKRAHERRARKSTLSPRFKVRRKNPRPAKKERKETKQIRRGEPDRPKSSSSILSVTSAVPNSVPERERESERGR